MTRSTPTRVNTDSCTANSPGVPRPKRPPISEYSPSLFSRTTSMSMASTPRSGLAKAAADELKKRGFAIGKVDNAPAAYDKKVPGTGMLLGGPTAMNGSFPVLATQLPGAAQKTDARRTADVDLIIGTKFKAFSTPAAAASALTALTKPAPAPTSC